MFTVNHFIWLAACVLLVGASVALTLRIKLSERKAAYIMAAICVFSEVGKIFSEMKDSPFGGRVVDPLALPFHLCSLMIFVVFFIALSNNEKQRQILLGFLVPTGLLGGVCAIIIPTNGVSFTEFPPYQCFVYHSALIWYALYSVLSGNVKIGRREYVRNITALCALAFIMIYVNGALSAYGTNFMFVVRPPMEGLPILNLDHGWGVYFGALLAIGMILMTLFHAPFLIVERKRERAEKRKANDVN